MNKFSERVMIKKVDSTNKLEYNKKKLSAILGDSHGQGWLGYYRGIGAKLAAEVLVSLALDIKDDPKSLKGLRVMRKAYLKGSISRRNSVRKIVKTVAKQCSSTMVERKSKPKGSLRQVKLESLSRIYLVYDFHSKFASQIPKLLKLGEPNSKATESRDGHKEKDDHPLSHISLLQKELPDSILGWPFHGGGSFAKQEVLRNSEAKDVNLPSRSNFKESENLDLVCPQEVNSSSLSSDVIESPRSRPGWPLLMIRIPPASYSSSESEAANNENRSNELELLIRKAGSSCKRFKYEELKAATSWFSSAKLIGQGGSSTVYKGRLRSGKSVAVKVLKPKKEAQKNFSMEVNIISSIKHKHIAPLIGMCLENGHRIFVHDFYPKGSLDRYLHGDSGRSVLPWKVRFNVAIRVAEALNYLHNDCPRPVIHRDVKSSNILLTNDFQPQLSDFGLAMWGSADSANIIQSDLVGTFGYIAPEYFMYGRVSDKIDVYSFGVVLLELLTGRKPIGPKGPKGQESLVNWAKNLLEGEAYDALLDPKLKGVLDVAQMHRMVLAAKRCISPSNRVRPKASQILKLLRGEKDAEELFNSHASDTKDSGYLNDDEESFAECCRMDRPHFEIIEADDGSISISPSCTTSLSRAEKTHRLRLKDFLSQPLD